MIVLKQESASLPSHKTIFVFGAGLIGSSIIKTLVAQEVYHVTRYSFPWNDQREQIRVIQKIADEEEERNRPVPSQWHIVWSAGRAGFSSSESETASELASYNRILDFAIRHASISRERSTIFHLISSAGGLYEGQSHITQSTIAKPLGPYGQLKAQQESLLEAAPDSLVKHVYRPSSVFGPIEKNHRRGLVPTLILNGLQHQVSFIVGHLSTLRDYVWVEDISKFIVSNMSNTDDGTYILASGKPTSILEIRKQIEKIIRRAVYINYSYAPSNSVDITFSRKALPQKWYPSDLNANITQIYHQLLQRGF